MDLTDKQWAIIKEHIPEDPVRKDGRGRPWSDQREVLEAILWVLRTGAPWRDLPERFPSHQTVHRRFQGWRKAGVIQRILRALARDLRDRGGLDLSECFIDASFSSAKKGAISSARPSGARESRSWRSRTAMVFLSPFARRALRQRRSGSCR